MNEENAGKRIISTSGHYAYLKISEGCDNHCTYCIIPKLRGKHRSRTMESLVEETKQLVEAGVKELLVVAQDTSIYGRDIYGKPMLHELLKKLCAPAATPPGTLSTPEIFAPPGMMNSNNTKMIVITMVINSGLLLKRRILVPLANF